MKHDMTIGQLAQAAGVHVETIRYYERRGLLPEPPRRASGYRVYAQDSTARLCFIKNLQTLGFSLKEIQELIDLRFLGRANCAEVRPHFHAKITEFEVLSIRKRSGIISPAP